MRSIIILLTFIWVGFVSAISFMESWLKFQAPNITTKLGVGIGKLVFEALNRMELIFVISIVITAFFLLIKKRIHAFTIPLVIAIVIVVVQTCWLLPELSARATLIIEGAELPQSNLHLLFVLFEIIKVFCLIIFGVNQLNLKMYSESNK